MVTTGVKKPARKKRPGPPPPPTVTWRGGVHIEGTPLWCDAERTREACFVSHADVDDPRAHRQVIATEATLKLLPKLRGRPLAVPYGRPFSLGTVRLELFPSGHCVGAASLAVNVGDQRVVYAGAVNPYGGGLEAAAESRPCDTLIIDATFGATRFRFPPAAEVKRAVRRWVASELEAGNVPILLARSLRACDLVALLGDDVPLRLHRSLIELTKRLATVGHELPTTRRFEGHPATGEAVIWPIDLRGAAALAAIRRARVGLVDGLAADPGTLVRLGVDAALPWSNRAGHAELVDYIVATGARRVYLTGASGDELVAVLAARRITARLLGPPRQLKLF